MPHSGYSSTYPLVISATEKISLSTAKEHRSTVMHVPLSCCECPVRQLLVALADSVVGNVSNGCL
jgi:hypothetical protein